MWGEALGHVMLDGYRFEITRLALRAGRIVIEAERDGPFPCLRGPVTIFGEDGHGFGQADTELELRAVSELERGAMRLSIAIDSLTAAK